MLAKLLFTSVIFTLFSSLMVNEGIISEDRDVKIVAHRGAMSEKPENTIEAFQHAVDLGADIIEIDLWSSSDGHLFILHDRTLNRTTDGTGLATAYSLDSLQSLDAGKWFGEFYEGLRIPSFREVLEWSGENEILLLLDLKEQGREFAEKVTAEVQSYGMEDRVIIGVRTVEHAVEFRELLPKSKQLAFMSRPDLIDAFSEAGTDVIRLWLRWLNEDPHLADHVHQTGKKLMINGTEGGFEETQSILSFFPDWILIDDIRQLKMSMDRIQSNK